MKMSCIIDRRTELEKLDSNYYLNEIKSHIKNEGIPFEEICSILFINLYKTAMNKGEFKNIKELKKPLEIAKGVYELEVKTNEMDKERRIAFPDIKYNLKITGIYEIVNLKNNKRYIGQSKNIKERWIQHKRNLNLRIHHCDNLQKDWEFYGDNCFRFNVIQEINEIGELSYYERFWWENAIGEKYNEKNYTMTDQEYKIKTLEKRVLKLEKELKELKGEKYE